MRSQVSISPVLFPENIKEIRKILPFSPHTNTFLLADENTYRECFPLIESLLPQIKTLVIPPGESSKTLENTRKIWEFLLENNATRESILINLGGGMICDIGGFAASTYKRGIDFIHLPTSLLAMTDASIGGKTGINLAGFKNQVGTFDFPVTTIIYTPFLGTLPRRELIAGFAEMAKHFLIADAKLWEEVKNETIDINLAKNYLQRSITIKKKIAGEDPYETGMRKALNFGHTLGHALESLFLHIGSPILHGEAIAWGMAGEAILSGKLAGLSEKAISDIISWVKANYSLPPINPSDHGFLFQALHQDKKNSGPEITFSLISRPGEPKLNVIAGEKEIKSILTFISENAS